MPLQIVRNDITKMDCDAVVNAANHTLLGGGGVDGAIHKAAGPGLRAECAGLGGCETGQAKLTGAYDLPCRYVIHTVGPVWRGGDHGEREMLTACYRNSLELAAAHGFQSIAFPLISAGAFGYPQEEAIRVAVDTAAEFLRDHEMLIYIVVFGRGAFAIGSELFHNIQSFIDDRYAEEHYPPNVERSRYLQTRRMQEEAFGESSIMPAAPMPQASAAAPKEAFSLDKLKNLLRRTDESFSEMLLRKIDEKGITDVECYKRANIDRKLFSKIRGNPQYKPSKPTVIAFAIALELSMDETQDLLKRAGFALSHSEKFDIIIEYCITNRIYNIYEVNEVLFAFDQTLLGA